MLRKLGLIQSIPTPVAVGQFDGKVVALHTSSSAFRSRLLLSTSADGRDFSIPKEVKLVSESGAPEQIYDCDHFRIAEFDNACHLSFVRVLKGGKKETVIARSTDLAQFMIVARTTSLKEPIAFVPDHRYKGELLAYAGNHSIRASVTKDLSTWHVTSPLVAPRHDHFDHAAIAVMGAVATDRGALALYDATDYKKSDRRLLLGAAIFPADQPYRVEWRSAIPVWEATLAKRDAVVRPIGAVSFKGQVHCFWASKRNDIVSMTLPAAVFDAEDVERAIALQRAGHNPIIVPHPTNPWETDATFNPTAVAIDGTVHLLYRAIGRDGMSVFGHATSADGVCIDERSCEPVYVPTQPFEYTGTAPMSFSSQYVSGPGWGGCEDPRLCRIDDTVYLIYTAFNGCNPPGVALTSLSIEDFLARNWNWKPSKLLSKPGEIQKNWVLFPEKINGKYAILHSVSPNISIEYLDSLDDIDHIESKLIRHSDDRRWDNIMRGPGPCPIRTNLGWLVLYHAMDKRDPNRYKLGAMILDSNDPTKILYRSPRPILEPVEWYENEGAKAGVIYACGAVIKDDMLHVYYGGADSVSCVATAPLGEFLDAIMQEEGEEIILQSPNVAVIKRK